MRKTRALLILAFIVWCAVRSEVARAGPAVWQRVLPRFLISDETVLVAHLNAENLSSQRILTTLNVILPEDLIGLLREAKVNEQLTVVDAFSQQFTVLGIDHLYAVVRMSGPSNAPQYSVVVLIPVDPDIVQDERQARLAQFQAMAAGFQARVDELPGWIILHREPALPVAASWVTVNDARFEEALDANPDHDLELAFVPTAAMQVLIATQLQQAIPAAHPQRKQILPAMENLVGAEWHYLSVKLGGDPALRWMANLRDGQSAQASVVAWEQMLTSAKTQTRQSLAAERRKAQQSGQAIQEELYDPQPYLELLDVLKGEPQGSRMVIHLNKPRLVSAGKGIAVMVNRLGEAIASAVVPDFGGSSNPGPQRSSKKTKK